MKTPRTPRTAATKLASGEPTTPAIVNRATPAGETVEGGVVPAETPTTPAVPSTEPLPSDQATAAPRPIDGSAPVTEADIDRAQGDRPSIVPETPPATDLVTPPDERQARDGVVMERVPGTVPLPSDQVTPVAPVAAAPSSLAASLALMTEDDRAAMRNWLGIQAPAGAPPSTPIAALDDADEVFEGRRLFPVAYDVDLDGVSYSPTGELIELDFAGWQKLFRATAVTVEWLRGKVVEA